MNSKKYSSWLKVVTIVIVLLMLVLSFFLYRFLFGIDDDSIGASIMPIENIDLEAYESLLDVGQD